MQIDRDLILRLEELAKLELSEEECRQLTGDLNKILAMVEKLEDLNLDGIEPLVYINEGANALREDEIKNQVSRKAALVNAPDTDGTYIKVPKVL